MREQSIARASKSGWVLPLLPSAMALGVASDLGPIAYFTRQHTELVFFVVVVPIYNKGEMKSS